MKIILTQEVTGLGQPGDVVEVKDGYGRNYLLPRGVAIRWTRGGEKQIVALRRARQIREIADKDQAKAVQQQLQNLKVNLKARAGESGRLFGAVTVGDIAGAIADTSGATVDKRKIILGNPIKSLGSHRVTVKVHDEVDATVNLNVVSA